MKVLSNISDMAIAHLSTLSQSMLQLVTRPMMAWLEKQAPPKEVGDSPNFTNRVADLSKAVEKMAFRSRAYAMMAWRGNQTALNAQRIVREAEFRETAELLVKWAEEFRGSEECKLIWQAFGGDERSEGPTFSIMGCGLCQKPPEVPHESAVGPELSVVCNPYSPTLFVYKETCDWIIVRPAVKLATSEDVYRELHPRFLGYAGRIIRRPGAAFIRHHLGLTLKKEAERLREQRDRIDRW